MIRWNLILKFLSTGESCRLQEKKDLTSMLIILIIIVKVKLWFFHISEILIKSLYPQSKFKKIWNFIKETKLNFHKTKKLLLERHKTNKKNQKTFNKLKKRKTLWYHKRKNQTNGPKDQSMILKILLRIFSENRKRKPKRNCKI